MTAEPATGTSSLRHAAPPAGYSLAPNRSVTRINATTTMPTSAPMSSVSTRKTWSSRSRKNVFHCCEEEFHQFFCAGSRVSLNSVLGISPTAAFLASLGRAPRLFFAWRRAAVFQQSADGVDQCRAACAQLADAVSRHLLEQLLSPRKQRHQDAPAIVPVAAPAHVAMGFQPVDQLDRAVMLQCQPVRQGPDGSFFAFGKAADRQQEQILLRLEARLLRHRVSFADKLANEVTEFREGLVLRRGDFFCHEITISQCDIFCHSSACGNSFAIRISAIACRGAACCAPVWQSRNVIAALDSRGNVEVRNCLGENPGYSGLRNDFCVL